MSNIPSVLVYSTRESRLTSAIMFVVSIEQFRKKIAPLFIRGRLNPTVATDWEPLGNIEQSIVVYKLPENPQEGLVNQISTVMMVHRTSLSVELEEWQTWTLTFLCLCFPMFGRIFSENHLSEYKMETYPDRFIEEVIVVCDDIVRNPKLAFATLTFDGFPTPASLVNIDFYNCADVDGLFGYFALVTHLMGKQITDMTRAVIEKRRPQIIIDTFSCKRIAFVLTGDGKLGKTAHTIIYTARSASDAPRKIFIKKFYKSRGVNSCPVRIVFLMFGMLEYSEMQSATFVHTLIDTCPWIIADIPLLSPTFTVYQELIEAFTSVDKDFAPFLKLYHRNASQIFHSKALQDSNTIACMWLSFVLPSMKDYKTVGGDAAK